MKEYKSEKLVAISRYRKFIPNLSEDIKLDIYARMQELSIAIYGFQAD